MYCCIPLFGKYIYSSNFRINEANKRQKNPYIAWAENIKHLMRNVG